MKLSFFLFSVCYMECVRCLVISTKNFSLEIGKTFYFIRVRVCTTLKVALFEQIVNLRNTLKTRNFNKKRQSQKL